MVLDFSCLYSTVKNTSGKAMHFGFLPPHGRKLAGDEEFTVFGDIRNGLGGNRGGEASVAQRDNDALQNAITDGNLEILSTPAPILQDTANQSVKMISLTSGSLAAVDACWTNSISV